MTESAPAIEVFTQPHCAPCREVERYLRDRGVPYVLHDVTDDPEALNTIAAQGFMATPVTRIGERWVGGFRKAELEAALREALT